MMRIINPKQTERLAFALLFTTTIFISCHNVEKAIKNDRRDTIELLSLSLGGKDFRELWSESYSTNQNVVYIALDSSGNLWPKKAGNVPLKVITDFDKDQDFIQISKETRFVVNPPVFKFFADSAQLMIYSYTFNLEHEFKFVKKGNKWILVLHSEHQY